MRSRQRNLDHKEKQKIQKKNDYIKSADAVRGEASLVGLMGTRLCDVGIEISSTSDSTPPHRDAQHHHHQTWLG